MIASIRGKVVFIDEDSLIIEANGIGYRVFCPLAMMAGQYRIYDEIFLYTHLIVREDAWQLYGFLTLEEITFFRHFLAISGIGGKIALAVLNQLHPQQVAMAILNGNDKPFGQVSGIGKKSAQRIVLELKDKVAKMPFSADMEISPLEDQSFVSQDHEAVMALCQLGYSPGEAKQTVAKILSKDATLSGDDVLRQALRVLSKF